MKFEWDETKSDDNLEKHGISFADAICIFDGPMVNHEISEHDGEIRLKDTGIIGGVIFAVIYTEREDRCRLISVRPASRKERRRHYDQSS